MTVLKKLLIVIWKGWFMFLNGICLLTIGLFWAFPLALFDKTFHLGFKGMRLWAFIAFYGSGFRLEFEKNEELDKNQTYIFISNHTSIVDIVLMALIHKNHPFYFVGKEELVKTPIFRTIYKRICITVDRSNIKSRVQVYSNVKHRLSLGKSIVLFPEGGIPDDRDLVLQRFKDGAFSIGISTQTPIVLYAIKGFKEMFPETWTEGYPGKVKVKLIDIIPTENLSLANKNELRKRAFDEVHRELSSN